ncbi:MBL fold metallo-hydrolase [Nocardia abscessus]|jgi:glyoxylase-like metal-dependent hydrolase (beta-lactamase superfamily II)|uniref:MBL fold metallo-hydrolase n=1 Tax=Nocardia TaxID=1817 RepID=UPI001895F417|nr:MBL fold metallo-hydrolase [Nocardia abscessus]MBF6472534.1 MBL fold metallo-hydrolase [Nocardia abscessus]
MNPQHKRFEVGDLSIIPINDGTLITPTPPQVQGEDLPDFEVHKSYIPGDGLFYSDLGAFLVRSGDQLVLLDAGLGPAVGHDGTYCGASQPEELLREYDQQWRNFGRDEEFVRMRRANLPRTIVKHGNLERNLRAAGVTPEEITDVVLSHLHCDHMGWCTKDGASFFPNADIWVHAHDVDHFLGDRELNEIGMKVQFGVEGTKHRMKAALEQLKLWENDTNVAPGIDVRHMPGHTPGSSIAVISSAGQRAMMLGDVIHCPLEMTDDQFSMMADVDPALAHETKLHLLRELEDSDIHVASTHFPGMRFGRLLSSELPNKRKFIFS